jgi:hypothetical protein
MYKGYKKIVFEKESFWGKLIAYCQFAWYS